MQSTFLMELEPFYRDQAFNVSAPDVIADGPVSARTLQTSNLAESSGIL